MSAAIRLEVAQEKVASMSLQQLSVLAHEDELWRTAYRVGVRFDKLKVIVRREMLRRGLLKMADLAPHERRELVEPQDVDIHAIAAGPIMDAAEIYLPAGKLSMAETKAREAGQVERLDSRP